MVSTLMLSSESGILLGFFSKGCVRMPPAVGMHVGNQAMSDTSSLMYGIAIWLCIVWKGELGSTGIIMYK